MKRHPNRDLIAAIGLAVSLAVSACSGANAPAPPTAQPTSAPAPAAPTPVAATATAVPATPTTAPTPTAVPATPTVAPTSAPTTGPTVAPTNTPAAQAATSGSAVSQSDLARTAQAMAAAKSYRITATTSGVAQGQSGTFVLEVVKPDRLHMKADMGGQTFEMITIGQASYLKIGPNWTKSPAPAGAAANPMILSSDPQKLLDQVNTSQANGTLTKGGTSEVDGTPCQEWVWTAPSSAASQGNGTICISTKDALPLQFKTADGKLVATYSDWNAPISIEAPM